MRDDHTVHMDRAEGDAGDHYRVIGINDGGPTIDE